MEWEKRWKRTQRVEEVNNSCEDEEQVGGFGYGKEKRKEKNDMEKEERDDVD